MEQTLRDTETAKQYIDAGLKAEDTGDRIGAIEQYEAAYTADPEDWQICFRLAYNLDLVGEEDEALHLYEEACRVSQPSLNALVNLAVMYEDRGKFPQAERCMRQILATDPNHPRARLFMKDIRASKGMVIDDDSDKRLEKHQALLDTPVTDFDLTVRTRNALRKMNIRTLGELLKITEAELRSFKNLGDGSLDEIKRMLAQRGLRLGQAAEQGQPGARDQPHAPTPAGPDEADEATLAKSMNELDLTVRARKALALLNVQTIGDLVSKTEAELMGVKNFGMTSLVEIKEKLTEWGLALRKLDHESEPESGPDEQRDGLT